jgi:hypothetical protein
VPSIKSSSWSGGVNGDGVEVIADFDGAVEVGGAE